MSDPTPQTQFEALADQLSSCADALHQRLMRALRQPGPDGAPPAVAHGVAQALFENEVKLRQRANALYLQAALLAGGGLAARQQELLAVVAGAEAKIAHIERIKDLVDIAAELLSLGAAVATGKLEHVAAPLEKLKHHLDAL